MCKNLVNKYTRVLCLLSVMMLMLACLDDDGDKKLSKGVLKVYPDSIELSDHEQEFSIHIECDDYWGLKWDADWLYPKKDHDHGDCVLNVKCTRNMTEKDRKAVMSIKTNADLEMIVTILQKGRPLDRAQLVSHRAILGNLAKNEQSYLEMTFDKPVTLKGFSPWGPTGTTPEYSEDRCTIRYPFPRARYGLAQLIQAKVATDDGGQTDCELEYRFYDKRYQVEGQIWGARVMPDEKSVWLALRWPVKLIELSLVDGTILHEVDMPFAPAKISLNPYNNLLYVLPDNFIADFFDNRLCVVDPKSGQITKTITFQPSSKTHPYYPAMYPYELEFTSDGFGVVMLCAKGADEFEWRYVDASKDDKIIITDYQRSQYWCEHIYQGCNQQSLYMNPFPSRYSSIYKITRQRRSPTTIGINGRFKSTYEYAGGNLACMLYHRYRNSVFIAAFPGSQCVVNLDDMTYSEVTDAESRGAVAAWDYRDPSRNLVFFVGGYADSQLDQHQFLLLDMDNAECIYHSYCIWNNDSLCSVVYLENTDQLLIIDRYQGIYFLSVQR